jgi:2-methylisocitrate lyase-like PEP mutase family enzyme
VREAAREANYALVINARIDVFLAAVVTGSPERTQKELVAEALVRAHAYLEAGADCVFPILLSEKEALRTFISKAQGPVNILAIPRAPSRVEICKLGAARVSYGSLLHGAVMQRFGDLLRSLTASQTDPLVAPEHRTWK